MKTILINQFCRICTMALSLFQLFFFTQSTKAQFSTESFNLQKASELYDERGFMKGKALSVDGSLVLNNSNGNVNYNYPVSSFNLHGYPMNVSLNYCGSVGFTAFQSYKGYYASTGCENAGWSKINQNKPLWIIGLNGFAVQTISQNTEPVCNAKAIIDYSHGSTPSGYKYIPDVWLVDGYDHCNRMRNFAQIGDIPQNRIDVIRLLRSDGSVLELCNRSDSISSPPITTAALYSGTYFEKGTNTKGYAIVEFKENRPASLLASINGLNVTDPIQMPRLVHYYPGDGLEYIFREDVAPYGSQFYLGTSGAAWAGEIYTSPTVFYLDEIRSEKRSLLEVGYRDNYTGGLPDIQKGRKQLSDFYGHHFSFGAYMARIESFGKTTDIYLDTLLRSPLSDNTFGTILGAAWEPTSLPMIKRIVDPAGRQVSFNYGIRTRTLIDYKWPYRFYTTDVCDHNYTDYNPVVVTKTKRMTQYNEPLVYSKISYYRDDSTFIDQDGVGASDLCRLSDVAKKIAKLNYNNDSLITREFTYYGLDTTGTSEVHNWQSVLTTKDNVTQKKTLAALTYERQVFASQLFTHIPGLGHTDLTESIEGTDSLKTKTETSYAWMKSPSDTVVNLRLPVTRTVTDYTLTDNVRRAYSTFEYIVDTTVRYKTMTGKIYYGFGVMRQYENVWRPDTITTLLYRKLTDYQAFPDSAQVCYYQHSWDKYQSIANYYHLKETDPSFTKSWEDCLTDGDPRVIVGNGTIDTVYSYFPNSYMEKAAYITDGDSAAYPTNKGKILQGSAKKFASILNTNPYNFIDRVKVMEDTVFGLGGKNYISSKIAYTDGSYVPGIQAPVTVTNTFGARTDMRYSYVEVPNSWGCTFDGSHISPLGKTRRNDNTDTLISLASGEHLYWWHEPLAETKRIRRYLPGHSGIDTMFLPTLYERTYYGLHTGVIDPNGWLTAARYDNIGRLLRLSYPYDFNSSSRLVELDKTVKTIREHGYTVMERKQYQQENVRLYGLCTDSIEYRTAIEKFYDYTKIYSELFYPIGGGGEESSSKAAQPLTDSCHWIPVGGIDVWDTNYYGFIPFTFNNLNIETLDSAVLFISPKIVDPCFTLFIDGRKVTVGPPATDTQVVVKSVFFSCDSAFTDTSSAMLADTGLVDRSATAIRIKLNATMLAGIVAGAGLNVSLQASTPYLAANFHNDGDDVMPQIKLYGTFKNDIDLTDYTLRYTYDDTYGKHGTQIYSKVDDTLHTSNKMAADSTASDNKRVSLVTNSFRGDNALTQTSLYRGNPSNDIKETISFTNNGFGKPIETADQLGYISRIIYDDLGRVTQVNNPDNVNTTGDTNSKVTTIYDIGSPLKFGIAPLDQDFYGFCSMKSVKNENDVIFTQYSDAFGRLRREVADSGSVYAGHFHYITRYDYDILGRLTKVQNPQGQITNYYYDDFGRVKYKKQPDLGILSYSYDAVGNVRFTQTNEQDSLGKLTFHQYDDMNRITVVGEARLGSITHDTLPNLHRWSDVLDPNKLHDSGNSAILTANKTLWDTCLLSVPYLSANATSSLCIPGAAYTEEEYSYSGSTFKQALGTVGADTLLASDSTNFENVATKPQNVRIVIHYDTVPRRSGAIWGHYTPSGLTNVWDSLCPTYKVRNMKGHEVAVAYRDRANEPFHYVTMSYDERGRVEALLRFTGNIGFDAVYYSYNSANQVIKLTTADGMRQHTTWYGYDWNGRIDSVWTMLGGTSSGLGLTSPKYPSPLMKHDTTLRIVYRYDKRGLVDSTIYTKANIVQNYNYNGRKWLDSMNAVKGTDTLFSQKLEFDNSGNIVKQISAQHGIAPINFEYTYDYINRLRLWKTLLWSAGEEFVYDSVGNRKSQAVFIGSDAPHHTNSYTYGNGNNQLTQVINPFTSVTTKYQYTGDGALSVRSGEQVISLAYQRHTRELFKYSYNGLLKSFNSGSWSAETLDCSRDTTLPLEWEWQYRYSAGGERESKRHTVAPLDGLVNTNHLWTYYLLGGNKQQLAVYNGRETDVADVCMNTGHRVHFYPTEYLTYGNGASALITTRPNGKAEYKIVDHLGSTRVVLNDTGKVISQYDFEPFGDPIAKTGLNSRKSFIDREKDEESGDENLGLRQMNPRIGRFDQIDPLWEKYRSMTPYQYAGNNPLIALDRGGDSIVVLQDWEGASRAGHQAVLIGGDDGGWQLYSKNGGEFGVIGKSEGGQAGEMTFPTLSDFQKNAEVDKLQGRYDNAIIIPTTVQQDAAAKKAASAEVKAPYLLVGASCTDVASKALKAAGKNPGTTNIYNGKTGDVSLADSPNQRYKDIQKKNNAKNVDKRAISSKRVDDVRNQKKEK